MLMPCIEELTEGGGEMCGVLLNDQFGVPFNGKDQCTKTMLEVKSSTTA